MQEQSYRRWFAKLLKDDETVRKRGWIDQEELPITRNPNGTLQFHKMGILVRCEGKMGTSCFLKVPRLSDDQHEAPDLLDRFSNHLGIPKPLLRLYLQSAGGVRLYLDDEQLKTPYWRENLLWTGCILYRELVANEFHVWVQHVLKQMKFPFTLTRMAIQKLTTQPTADVHFWLLREYHSWMVQEVELRTAKKKSASTRPRLCNDDGQRCRAIKVPGSKISVRRWKGKLRRHPRQYEAASCGGLFMFFTFPATEGYKHKGETDYASRSKFPSVASAARQQNKTHVHQPQKFNRMHKQQQKQQQKQKQQRQQRSKH